MKMNDMTPDASRNRHPGFMIGVGWAECRPAHQGQADPLAKAP